MCGIAGSVNCNDVFEKDIRYLYDIKNVLKRRGPDQDGVYINNDVALVHTRLAVIDVMNGIQPMITKEYGDDYIIVYNGEIYNTDEVRNELKYKGHNFNGHSDTEVVLKAFIEWGEDSVKKLNGIFAYAIWSEKDNSLFMARDRMGVKPLFYSQKGDRLIFSSEIKGMLAHPLIRPQVDLTSIAEIMLIGPGRTMGYGIYKDVSELLPGYSATFKDGRLKIQQYWKLEDKECNDTFEQCLEKVTYLVTDSIKRQIVSDVPLGTFLSGGLDSSAISAITNREYKKQNRQLDTFSVEYVDNEKYFKVNKFQPNSDNIYVDKMVEFLGSNHHYIKVDTPELVKGLFMSVDARDLPGMADVDSSMLLFCKEVKNTCKVALSGECADEIFGGYPWYRDKEIRMTDGFPWSQSTAYRNSLLRDEIKMSINANQYVYGKYLETIGKVNVPDDFDKTEKRMREMFRLNVDWFMQNLLERKDRMSMYSGLEVRVPFCDYRIAEYLYSVPWKYKDYEGREKGLLRKALEVDNCLPEEILWRKKSPYPKTHNPNYLAAVTKLMEEVIENSASPILHIVKKSELEKLLNRQEEIYWYGQLMAKPQTIAYLLQINYWLDKYNICVV